MNTKGWLWAAGLLASSTAVIAVVLTVGSDEPRQEGETLAAAPTEIVASESPNQASILSESSPTISVVAQDPIEKPSDDAGPVFQVDASGNLLLDERTRFRIEALIALTAPDKLQAAIDDEIKNLPPAAMRKAEELVDRYHHYQAAQRTSYPPGVAPLTEEDALTQLDGLHALREAHFGPEVATAFYQNEEALARELVELMRLEKDQSLTMPEKAERAQTIRDRLPKVAAIEKRNRESRQLPEGKSAEVESETAQDLRVQP